jgi:predicted PurR-regulated permease PerM
MDVQNTVHIGVGTIIKTVIILILFYVAFLLKGLILVLLLAIVIASSVEPLTKWFSRRGVPRVLSVILIYLCMALILIGTVYFILLPLLGESSQVLKILPTYFSSESSQTSDFLSNQPFVSGLTNTINFSQLADQVNTLIANISSGAFNSVATVFGGILSFLLTIVLSFYLAVNEGGIASFLKIVTPIKHEVYVLDLWRRAQMKIGLWMQGQLILAVIIALLVYLGLTLMSIPNALLLAFLAGVFEIIPLFGPILASIPAIALSFIGGGLSAVVLVAGLYLIIHQFENHLIYPLVVKKITGVSPVVSILALVAGFELGGFLGLVLSVPIATVLIEFFDDLERNKIAKIEKMKG